uniref:Uncharacterized protein n=1 Tax=Rhizophora mucronata TaxID=61149 RepID=A0A2P2IPS1_RHIMU
MLWVVLFSQLSGYFVYLSGI